MITIIISIGNNHLQQKRSKFLKPVNSLLSNDCKIAEVIMNGNKN